MEEFDIPIFKKVYDLYKEFYFCIGNFPRKDKYSLGQKCESIISEIMECVLEASQLPKSEKSPYLEKASVKLNLLRMYTRLAKEIRALDINKYILIEEMINEIGKMLGGWKRFIKNS